jgi:hypothetical protein
VRSAGRYQRKSVRVGKGCPVVLLQLRRWPKPILDALRTCAMSVWRLSARATELEQRQDHSTSKSLYIQQCGEGSPLLMLMVGQHAPTAKIR